MKTRDGQRCPAVVARALLSARRSRKPLLALIPLIALELSGGIGCGVESAAPEQGLVSALRERFPERAALVLEREEAFVATGAGFVLERPGAQGAWQGIDVVLPHEGRESIRFRGFGGVEVRVREVGLEGEGTSAEQAVAYRRAGGASFWTAVPGEVEEWLHLEASAVHAGEAVAAWEVEGATVRQRGDVVDVVDESGVVRLSVAAPVAYAANGEEVGTTLVGSGARIELHVDTAGEAVLIDPVWTVVASMSHQRIDHTATLLASGKVLVASGYGWNTAEVYDPATNTWSPTGAMGSSRSAATATLLASGKVLVAGGVNGGGVASAELYAPATNTWSAAGTMSSGRWWHTATLLPSGKVLVTGGATGGCGYLANADLYDPATNTWSAAAPMSQPRGFHAATLLASGKVLIAGGANCGSTVGAELYDPATNTWSPTNPMIAGCAQHTATLLGSGKVLVAGCSQANAQLYDPATNTWSAAAPMSQDRGFHTATLLSSGHVLVTGGGGSNTSYPCRASAEMYDPLANTWSPAPTMSHARTEHTATLLASGDVLVAGGGGWGCAGNGLSSAELYGLAPLGSPCALDSDCQSGFCTDGVCCNAACDAGSCDACSIAAGAPANGTCTSLTGTACDDGDACTQTDTCQSGACVGANPVVCPSPGQCHAGGVCNPGTGVCSAIVKKPDGASCDDGNGCTQIDTCQSGACVGASPVVCAAEDQCHFEGACDPATGMCSSPVKPNGTKCNDGITCNGGDICQAGVCTGSGTMPCPATDQCHEPGICDPSTNTCTDPVKADGAACDDGDECTQDDTCQAGVCTGGSAVSCTALDTCHVPGKCDPQTGVCTNIPKPGTAACDDGNPCTQKDTCEAGVCMGGDPMKCPALDGCHDLGVCDVATGACTNPSKPDGAACPDGTCSDGVCVSTPAGASGTSAACGCGISGDLDPHASWLALGLLLARRRRRRDVSPIRGAPLS